MADIDLRLQRIVAHEKDTRAIIARDFSCSRMNNTKWQEAMRQCEAYRCRYRLKLIGHNDASAWGWMSHMEPEHPTYVEHLYTGPVRFFEIEWMEAEPENGVTETLADELRLAGVPFELSGVYVHIDGYVK